MVPNRLCLSKKAKGHGIVVMGAQVYGCTHTLVNTSTELIAKRKCVHGNDFLMHQYIKPQTIVAHLTEL